MSDDRTTVRGADAWRARAGADLRAAHRAAQGVVAAGSGGAWSAAAGTAWSPAEVSLHLALTQEVVLQELLDAAARGAQAGDRRGTLLQRAAWASVAATWWLPGGCAPLPGTDPQGVIPAPEAVRGRLARSCADLLDFLDSRPGPLLPNLRAAHPSFGDLDPAQWARYLRIHARAHELRKGPGPVE